MKYDKLAEEGSLNKVIESLKNNNFESVVVENKEEALAFIKNNVPKGVSVMNGASISLEQIGFVDYLKSDTHGWNNLHKAIVEEKDPVKQGLLRKQSVISDYYLGSAHAITENGEIMIASNTGSQLPHLVFTSPNIILVVGTQKIVPTLADALNRLEQYIFPLEDQHMKDVGWGGSMICKILFLRKENKMMGRKITVVFVKEKLGF